MVNYSIIPRYQLAAKNEFLKAFTLPGARSNPHKVDPSGLSKLRIFTEAIRTRNLFLAKEALFHATWYRCATGPGESVRERGLFIKISLGGCGIVKLCSYLK